MKRVFSLLFVLFSLTAAANNNSVGAATPSSTPTPSPTPTSTPGCYLPDSGIIPPTAIPYTDPVLGTPTATPATTTPTPTITPTPLIWCTVTPTPEITASPTSSASSGGAGGSGTYPTPPYTPTPHLLPDVIAASGSVLNGTGIDSITVDITNQDILATAMGTAHRAVFWKEGNTLVVSLVGDGDQPEIYPLIDDVGNDLDADFSRAERLHIVYSKNHIIHYIAAAKQLILHTNTFSPGEKPSIAIDNEGWAHIAYLDNGAVYFRSQTTIGWTSEYRIGIGQSVDLSFNDDGSFIAAVKDNSVVRIYYSKDGRNWEMRASYDTGNIKGSPRVTADGRWVYTAWITEQLDPTMDDWPRRRPEYKPAMPFINRVYEGENSQQYFTRFGIHDAGIYQTFQTSPGTLLVATAKFMGWSCGEPSPCSGAGPSDPNPSSGSGANMRAQICIDPNGGSDIYSQTVVCSSPNNTLDQWVTLGVSAVAQNEQATVFLRTQPDLPRSNQDAYWDDVQLSGGTLINPGLNVGFSPWNGIQELKVADGWNPFYVEDPPQGISGGRYYVHTAWSNDGGLSWSESVVVAANRTEGKNKTGAFAADAYPIVNEQGGYAAFVYLFMAGDPPPETGQKRYGYPAISSCNLGKDECTFYFSYLLPRNLVRPVQKLVADVGYRPVMSVAWAAYQSSQAKNKDIFATTLLP